MELPRFYVAQYPVTVAQFRAFVEDDEIFAPGDPDCLRGFANHPVELVSWHEALQYCEWLTRKLRAWDQTPNRLRGLLTGEGAEQEWRVTLPSEAEWEKAARGSDRRIYPWGDEADSNRANYDDTGIGSTSAVGCFPDGVSPLDVEEMSGNAWEWTRSVFKGYPYESTDGREALTGEDDVTRVLRGGSFEYPEGSLRAACRLGFNPGNRHLSIGFRV